MCKHLLVVLLLEHEPVDYNIASCCDACKLSINVFCVYFIVLLSVKRVLT